MKMLVRGLLLMLALFAITACDSATVAHSTNPNTITLGPASFQPTSIVIKRESTITFVDDANNGALHILVIGHNGEQDTESGAPDFGGAAGQRTNIGDVWTTGAWNTDGAFHVTCTIHPNMNLTVTVTG